jgi:FkbM family methyltransferase
VIPSPAAREPLREFLRFFTRIYPLLSGCGTIAQTRILSSLVKSERDPKIVRLKSGELLIIILDDYVGRSVYYFGDLDPKVSWLCRNILRRGDTAIDIGANLGLVAVTMASVVGSLGAVHAFEPQPDLASLIMRSAKLNGFDHLHVHRTALGNQDDCLELSIPYGNAGSASLIRRKSKGTTKAVPVKESGPYLEQLGLGPIRLIKIDVEGFEDSVFSGAASYLRRNPADAILFESNDYSIDFANQPVTKTLLSLGYSFLEIKKSFTRMHLRRIDLKNPRPRYSHDIIAVHQGPNARDILASIGIAPL